MLYTRPLCSRLVDKVKSLCVANVPQLLQVVHEQAIVTRRSTRKKTNPAAPLDANVVTTDDEQRPLTSAERLPPRSPPDGRPDHSILPPPSNERNNNFVQQHSNSAGRSYAAPAGSSISHHRPDAALYGNATALPLMPRKEGDMEKFPSTSCIDDLSKRADTRALLQRFLDDQSRLNNEIERVTKDGPHKERYSLRLHGSALVDTPKRSARSDDTEHSRSVLLLKWNNFHKLVHIYLKSEIFASSVCIQLTILRKTLFYL